MVLRWLILFCPRHREKHPLSFTQGTSALRAPPVHREGPSRSLSVSSYKIKRIQEFYMRKVKFTQSTCVEKLQTIVDEFPHLEVSFVLIDLAHSLIVGHPSFLCRSHQRPLRQRPLQVGSRPSEYCKEYHHTNFSRLCPSVEVRWYSIQMQAVEARRSRQVRLVLSLRCPRMCTVLKKLNSSLCYLEEVRKHLSRLPAIDPKSRTLVLCGFPNVGKSSFMNTVTRANVDVQPYELFCLWLSLVMPSLPRVSSWVIWTISIWNGRWSILLVSWIILWSSVMYVLIVRVLIHLDDWNAIGDGLGSSSCRDPLLHWYFRAVQLFHWRTGISCSMESMK